MKRYAFFLFIIAIVFAISCSDNSDTRTTIPVSPELIGNSEEMEITKSFRETEIEADGKLAKTMEDVNWDDYSLIIKDNENYYYFLNVSNNLYSGKTYFKSSNGYSYRGECKMIKKGTTAIALWYLDSRYSNNNLTTITAPGTGYGALYFQPRNRVWSISISIQKGSL